MRRTPTTRPEHLVALSLAEIERLKAMMSRITDGRQLLIDPGTGTGDTTPVVEAGPHVLYGSKHTKSLKVTALTSTDYFNAVIADSPRAYWRLGETTGSFADSADNDNPGTANGGMTRGVTGAIAGDSDKAVTLNGTTGYISVADHADLDVGDVFTIEAWIKKAADGTFMSVVAKGVNGYQLRMSDANTLQLLKENVSVIVSSTTTITGTAYHHVVATKNGATVKLYIDGADVTGTVTNATILDTASALHIGRRVAASDEFFNGTIDEVAIYATALSAADVLDHFNKGSLHVNFEDSGVWRLGVFYSIAAGSIAVADGTTNFVHVTNAGVVASNTTGFPGDSIPLATVVTAGGAISSVNERRAYLDMGLSVDPNFQAQIVSSNPRLTFDVGDYFQHQRSGNIMEMVLGAAGTWQVVINAATQLLAGTTQVQFLGNTNAFDSTGLIKIGDDTGFNIQMVSAEPRLTFDSGDYFRFDRTTSRHQFFLGNVAKLGIGNTDITVGVDGSAPALILSAVDGANEGGEIQINGAAANADWTFDNNSGILRFFTGGASKFQIGDAFFRGSGYARVGSVSAPANVTAGDLTVADGSNVGRIQVGANTAFGDTAQFGRFAGTMTHETAGAKTFYLYVPTFTPAANSSSEFRTLYFQGLTQAPDGVTMGTLRGGFFEFRARGSAPGAITEVNPLNLQAFVVDSSSPASNTVTTVRTLNFLYLGRPSGTSTVTVTDIIGADFATGRLHAGVTGTTMRDIFIRNPTAPAALTTHVGIDIEALTRAGTNFGIRNASNSVQTGYARFGGITAPTNVTDGDVTATRLNVGDQAAFGTHRTFIVFEGGVTPTAGFDFSLISLTTTPNGGNFAQTALNVSFDVQPSANDSGDVRGMNYSVAHSAGAFNLTGVVSAVRGLLTKTAGGTVTSGRVLEGLLSQTAGTITTGQVVRAEVSIGASATLTTLNFLDIVALISGTITTVRGLNIPNIGAAGVTTAYGIDIAAITGAGTNIGIRNLSTLRQVGGSMFGVDAVNVALVHIQGQTLGNEIFRLETVATNDDPSTRYYGNRVTTTGATVTTLHTVAIPASTTVKIKAYVTARRTGGAAGAADDGAAYEVIGTYKTVAGTVTLIGAVSKPYVAEDQAAWDVNLTISGTNVLVEVTGAASNDITWHLSRLEIQQVGS